MTQRLSLINFSISRNARNNQAPLLCLLLATLTAVCFVNPAYAVDPNRAFSQYIRNQWSAENGFSGDRLTPSPKPLTDTYGSVRPEGCSGLTD